MPKGLVITLVLWLFMIYGNCKRPNKAPIIRILPGRLVPRFDFFRMCDNVSLKVLMSNVTMRVDSETNKMTISADMEVRQWIYKITKTIVQFYNCADFTEGSCQRFQTWHLGEESCRLLLEKEAFWTPLVDSIHPKFNCPLAPGLYVMRNGTLNMKLMQRLPFPLERYYWRFRTEVYDPEMFNCVIMGARFLRART